MTFYDSDKLWNSQTQQATIGRVLLKLAICCLSSTCFSATTRRLDLGLSYISYHLFRTAQADDGSKGTLGSSFYDLKIQYHAPITESILFSPELLFMPEQIHANKSPDGALKTSITILSAPFVYNIYDAWDVSTGFGILHYTLKGNGGTQVLSNGNGESTFSLPSRSVTTRTLVWQFGAAYRWRETRFGVDYVIQDLFSSRKRAYSLVLGASHNLLPYF